MEQQLDELMALSMEFQVDATRRGIRVLRARLVFVDDELLPRVRLSSETPLAEIPALAEALGVQLMYLDELIFEDDDPEDDPDQRGDATGEHLGQCQTLRVAFPYNGILHVWERYASWTDDEFGEDDLDDRGIEEYNLAEADRHRLVAYAAEHASLKHLPPSSVEVIRHAVTQHLVDIAREIDINLSEDFLPGYLTWKIARLILDNQRNAVDAIDRDLEAWAQRVSQDPAADLPTAAERDRFCQRYLSEHLGFTPTQTLAGKLRKLSDSYRKRQPIRG